MPNSKPNRGAKLGALPFVLFCALAFWLICPPGDEEFFVGLADPLIALFCAVVLSKFSTAGQYC